MKRYLLLLPLIILFSDCEKTPPAASRTAVTPPPNHSMPDGKGEKVLASEEERRAFDLVLDKRYGSDTAKKDEFRRIKMQLDAEGDALERLAVENHRSLVDPPPADFKPDPAERKIRLRIILEKSRISAREQLRYRLEMMNAGRAPLDYSENAPSIFKYNGIGYSSTISFLVTDPSGKTTELHAGFKRSRRIRVDEKPEYLPDGMPAAQKEKWYRDTLATAAATQHFQVRLAPGETLRTQGTDSEISSGFRTLWCEEVFSKPGRYSIRVSLDDRPARPDSEVIGVLIKAGESRESIERDFARDMKAALGPVSTESVVFEVAPPGK